MLKGLEAVSVELPRIGPWDGLWRNPKSGWNREKHRHLRQQIRRAGACGYVAGYASNRVAAISSSVRFWNTYFASRRSA